MRKELKPSIFGDKNKIVGFAVLVEINGEKILIFSDSVNQGSFTLLSETHTLQSDDDIAMVISKLNWYDVSLSGTELTVRREGKSIGEIIEVSDKIKLLEAKDDPS